MRVGEGKKEVYILAILLIFAFAIASPVSGQFAIEQIPIRGNFTYMAPDNLIRGSALEALMNSQEEIRAMQGYNLTANYVSDLLLKAKRAYIGEKYSYLLEDLEKEEDRRKISYLESLLEVAHATPDYDVENVNLSKVFMLTQLITYRKNQAYRILDSFPLVEDKERLFREQDVNTSAGMELLLLAKTSFREERYDEAEKYVERANEQLDRSFLEYRRLKSIIFLGRNFLLRNWWQILLVIAVLAITVPPIARRVRVSMARRKIERLQLEYESLTESLKEAQKERFVGMTITDKAYQARADVFLERMTKIKHTIPVLEAIVKGEISEKAEKKPEKTEKPQIKRPEAPAIKGMARKGVIESALKKLAIMDLASRIRVLGKNSYANMRGFSSRALFSMRKLDIAVYGRTKKTFRKAADLVSKIYQKKPKAEAKEEVREEAKAEEILVKKAAVKKIPVQKKILLKPYAVKVAKLIKDSSVKLGEYGGRALTRSRELDIMVYGKIKNSIKKARELLSKYPAKPKVMKKKMEAEKKEEMIEIIEEPQPEFLPGIEEKVEEEAAKPKVSRKPLVKPGKALSEAYQRTASQLRGSALKALDYSRKLDQKAYGYLKSFITGIKSIRPSKGRKEEIRKEEEKPKEKIRWVDVKKDVAERQRKERERKAQREKARRLIKERLDNIENFIRDYSAKALGYSKKLDEQVYSAIKNSKNRIKDALSGKKKQKVKPRPVQTEKVWEEDRALEALREREEEYQRQINEEKAEFEMALKSEIPARKRREEIYKKMDKDAKQKRKEKLNKLMDKIAQSAKSLPGILNTNIKEMRSRIIKAAGRKGTQKKYLETKPKVGKDNLKDKIKYDISHSYFKRLKQKNNKNKKGDNGRQNI